MKIPFKKQRQKNRKLRTVIIIGVTILVLTALAAIFMFFVYPQIKSSIQRNDSLKSIDADKKGSLPEDNSNNPAPTGEVDESKTITPSEPEETVDSIETPSITRAEMSSNGQVRVAAIFTQAAYGNCVVTFTKSGQADVVQSAPIILQASYYACNGFLIPSSNFPAKGEWSFTVTHEYSGQKATTDKRTITIE